MRTDAGRFRRSGTKESFTSAPPTVRNRQLQQTAYAPREGFPELYDRTRIAASRCGLCLPLRCHATDAPFQKAAERDKRSDVGSGARGCYTYSSSEKRVFQTLPERLYLPVKTTERTSPRAPDRQTIPKKDDNKIFKKVFCICFENRHLPPNFNFNVNTPRRLQS